MSHKRKKSKQPKFQGTKITGVVVDELSTTQAGLWADPEPKHTKPAEEPIEELVYAQGGILAKNPMGLFGDSRTAQNFDGIHTGLAGLSRSLGKVSDSFQQIGRALRNVGPITVMVDSEAPISQETIDRILKPQQKQEPLVPTTLAKAVNPKLNNLCQEVELPPKALSVEEHREFIRDMMKIDARAIKNMYYQKPALIGENPGEKESFIPNVRIQVEGRKPHIQQFVDIVKEVEGRKETDQPGGNRIYADD
uniref:Uncharacterized protein n=1 Tax=Pseudomonas phage Nican01 TaxID=3138540 RepID=A0AAU6W1C6_9CAUD